ncbi:hypothetical protein [Arthrobacter sp. ISL-65]|uniref:hypothetical protein n=1 Tax=Arthrobacter sp. ISL-65 TaxID=2819112 RepID=UPI001BEBD658|nr:hypothetical protein [Arthrobacter sp. ISL-65]MBT2550806.1 hypothetical protein [Arthrobacter sp. ISL-65]
MNEAMTETGQHAERGPDLNGHLTVTVYIPAHEPDAIYVQAAGTWLRYEKYGPCPETDANEWFNRAQDRNGPEPVPEPLSLHWAGHRSGSSQELIRKRRPRVYCDPQKHPDLFVTQNDGPPTAPLPALELTAHPGDPEPWVDPNNGTRFTCEQARTATAILRYAPRKDHPSSRGGENRECPGLERIDTVCHTPTTTRQPPARTQGAHEMVSSSR